jgi:hypothetical protein
MAGELVLAGAHGGAGVTTLAALLQPAWDLGTPRRTSSGFPPIRAGGRPIVLVTRGTVAAAGRATTAVNAITCPGVRIAVLAIVGDGLPEPAEAGYRFRLLQARVGGLVHVPFVPQFRATGDPASVKLPRRARDALARIRVLARTSHPAPARRA